VSDRPVACVGTCETAITSFAAGCLQLRQSEVQKFGAGLRDYVVSGFSELGASASVNPATLPALRLASMRVTVACLLRPDPRLSG